MLLLNQDENYKPITSRLFEEPEKAAGDMMRFGVRQVLAIIREIETIQGEDERSNAIRAFQRDMGPFWSKVLGPFSLKYMRGLPEGRLRYGSFALKEAFETFAKLKLIKGERVEVHHIRNLRSRLKDVEDTFEEEKGGRR